MCVNEIYDDVSDVMVFYIDSKKINNIYKKDGFEIIFEENRDVLNESRFVLNIYIEVSECFMSLRVDFINILYFVEFIHHVINDTEFKTNGLTYKTKFDILTWSYEIFKNNNFDNYTFSFTSINKTDHLLVRHLLVYEIGSEHSDEWYRLKVLKSVCDNQ